MILSLKMNYKKKNNKILKKINKLVKLYSLKILNTISVLAKINFS